MSPQNGNLETYEPQSLEQAEGMILHLRDEITQIQNQLTDPERRNSMAEDEYASWSHRANAAARHKKGMINRLSVWCNQQKRRDGNPSSLDHITVGRSLKLASKQYGRLIEVMLAAEEYINSPGEEDDEQLLATLAEKVMLAREIVLTEADVPAPNGDAIAAE
jgi:hypothetical protein